MSGFHKVDEGKGKEETGLNEGEKLLESLFGRPCINRCKDLYELKQAVAKWVFSEYFKAFFPLTFCSSFTLFIVYLWLEYKILT